MVIGLSVGALLYVRNPAVPGSYGKCPSYALTGLYCAGCGTLRGLNRLLHADLRGAFAYNPLMVASLPFLWYAFVRYAMRVWTPRLYRPRLLPGWIIWMIFGIFVAYSVLRNIPVYPLTCLAPHGG